jgi:hypothetical protein
MISRTRREFLADVGRGVLVAGIGSTLATQLGLAPALADEPSDRLTFGNLEPLVALLQETPPDKLLPLLVEKLSKGTELRSLVAAGALANARSFGGEDYVGFHTMMALAPSFHMSAELPAERKALPVFKVLFRNSNRCHEKSGGKEEVLRTVKLAKPDSKPTPQTLIDAVHGKDMAAAEQAFLAGGPTPEDALNFLLPAVQEMQEVHRIVLPYRAWDLLPVVGKEHALTLLRQSVHYCVKNENPRYQSYGAEARALLPKLLEQYKLPLKEPGRKKADDTWIDKTSQAIFKGKPSEAAEVVAAALAEGFSVEAIGEALALATNQLVLRDNGRPKEQAQPNKPVGSVHGDGIGVHACDSSNAWRNLALVSSPRNAAACLILGAYQAARDRGDRGGEFLTWEPYPRTDARAAVKTTDKDELLKQAEAAIQEKDQARASACVAAYGDKGYPERAVFDLLLRYAISEDGALHAEKYYRTVTEEFALARPAFRWRHLVALARVTASAAGQPAPGYAEACRLLKV